MNIHVIGTRGWSYAGTEDLVREISWRFVRDGHAFTIHAWATEETVAKGIREDDQGGVKRIFHKTTHGKYSAQLLVALKSTIAATFSDCDLIYFAFIQNGIYSWLPRLVGKRIFTNVDGIMWKDPKWPPVFRHIFFPAGAYLCCLFGNKVITDAYHMAELYRKKFGLQLDWVGYGCADVLPERKAIDVCQEYPDGYYVIMSRQTPHNLTDLMVEGFIRSGSKRMLLIAGHMPSNRWFDDLQKKARGHRVRWLGLIKDQEYLTQLLFNASAYLHGHSLGGINPALVRVTGLDVPAICVDTAFNREVVEWPNKRLQAQLFSKNPASVANAVTEFEKNEVEYRQRAKDLGITIRKTMSWESIYQQYKKLMIDCL